MRDGERLVVNFKGECLQKMPVRELEQLILLGNVQLTTQATALLLDKGVDVVYLSTYWKYRGRLSKTGSPHAELRHAQLLRMSQEQTALPIAQAVVQGKINNQLVLLQRQADNRRGIRSASRLKRSVEIMKRMRQSLPAAAGLDQLRGYEGSAGAAYFAAIGALLDPEWHFRGRNYHPPRDPFNALLSFGYTLLLKDITTAVQIVGLDPYMGFFHALNYGRPSLCLDMMEEFRPVLVDSLVLEIVNRAMISPGDFQRTENPRRPVALGDAGCRMLMEQYQRRLYSSVFHSDARGETSYRRVLELQARRLAKVILGKREAYEPVLIR